MIHIHNGDVVANLARRAHIAGTHVAFRESLVAGPILTPATREEWIEARAQFIAEAHGEKLLRVRNSMIEEHDALDGYAAGGDEVVLWFEHDLFCLVHLLYLVAHFKEHARLSLVWHPQPLGLLAPDDLVPLFDARQPVSLATRALAVEAWQAYAGADPLALNRFLASDWPELPFLREGFTLHASRFPSTVNGLGELENRALAAIRDGITDWVALFDYLSEPVPRFGFGDTEVLRELRRLAREGVALITISEADASEGERTHFALTPAGESVVAGSVDYTNLTELDEWLGGAQLRRERMWRWDAAKRQLVESPSAAS